MDAIRYVANFFSRRFTTHSSAAQATSVPRSSTPANRINLSRRLEQPVKLETAATLYASATQPEAHLGNHFIWVLRHIYDNSSHISSVKKSLHLCNVNQRIATDRHDQFDDMLQWAKKDSRIFVDEFDETMEQWSSDLEEALEVKISEEIDAARHSDELQLTQRLEQEGWKALHIISQEYVNLCLDANFKEDWCLSHGACLDLRNLARIIDLIRGKRTELVRLNRLQTSFVNSRRRAQASQRASVTFRPSSENERQDTSYNRSTPELLKTDLDIAKLKTSIQFSEESLEEKKDIFLKTHVKPYIDRMLGASEEEEDDAARTATSSRRSPTPNDWEDPERLTSWYLDVRSRHQALQAEYLKQRQEAQAGEPNHLRTFTNSSRARFSRYVDSQLENLKRELTEIEAQRYEMHDRILEMGIKLPEPDNIDSFRFSTRQSQAADTAATPPSGDGLRELPDYEQRSKGSLSASPSSAKKRRLREYERLQSSERRKKAKVDGNVSRDDSQVNE